VFLEDGPEAELDPLAELPSWSALQAKLLSTFRNTFCPLSRGPSESWDPWRLGTISALIPAALGPSFGWGDGTGGWQGKKLEPG